MTAGRLVAGMLRQGAAVHGLDAMPGTRPGTGGAT
jgi:hypothetical protein